MSVNYIAFTIGLAGSVHCVGMCGPLAFAIPSAGHNWMAIAADKLLYNLGRIFTYTILGLLLGNLGKLLWLGGLQQVVSIASGIIIIVAATIRIFKLTNRFGYSVMPSITKLIGFALRNHYGHFALGVLNGLLPCGFVYVALFAALNNPIPLQSAVFMFWFGIGTLPLMMVAMMSIRFLGPLVRQNINRIVPYLLLGLGFWLVVRGSSLNIPYLSPLIKQVGVSFCH